MQFRYTDDEISDMLKNSYSTQESNIHFDTRIFEYWLEDLSTGYPYPGVDMKYNRYFLVYPMTLTSDGTIYVNDVRNPYFSVPLDKFFSLDASGKLPVEMTKRQRRMEHLKIALTLFSLFAFIGFVTAEFLTN